MGVVVRMSEFFLDPPLICMLQNIYTLKVERVESFEEAETGEIRKSTYTCTIGLAYRK